MTVTRDQFERLCRRVHEGEFTESQVIWWMHYDGWPGHTPLECWQWWEGEYRAWKRRNRIDDADQAREEPAVTPPPDTPASATPARWSPRTSGVDPLGRTRKEAGRG